MLRLVVFVCFFLIQFSVFSQTFVWKNEAKTKGSVSFVDVNIKFLIVRFDESYSGYDRAGVIYKQNIEENQNKLEKLLEESGLNYELISRDQLKDSTYMDTDKYPVVLDHETYMSSSGTGNNYYSYLRLLVTDRKTKIQVKIILVTQATKYVKPFKKFIKKVKKGKSMITKIP